MENLSQYECRATERIFEKMKFAYVLREIPADKIHPLKEYQVRETPNKGITDPDHVEDIRLTYQLGEVLAAAVAIAEANGTFKIIDGRHRVTVWRQEKAPVIAYVLQHEQVTEQNRLMLAARLNDRHGKPNCGDLEKYGKKTATVGLALEVLTAIRPSLTSTEAELEAITNAAKVYLVNRASLKDAFFASIANEAIKESGVDLVVGVTLGRDLKEFAKVPESITVLSEAIFSAKGILTERTQAEIIQRGKRNKLTPSEISADISDTADSIKKKAIQMAGSSKIDQAGAELVTSFFDFSSKISKPIKAYMLNPSQFDQMRPLAENILQKYQRFITALLGDS
jgi:hypothetical protein